MKRIFSSFAFIITLGWGAAMAVEPQPVQQNNSNAVWFENWIGLSKATMAVATPSGELISLYAASGTPVFELKGNEVLDGIYRYELSAATEEEVKIVNKIDEGRGDASKDTSAKPFYFSGAFVVERGVIVQLEEIAEE